MAKIIDITGKKFNRLTAIKFMYSKNQVHYWLFKCKCGKEVVVRKNAVTSGQQKSCGCLQLEKVKRKKYNKFELKKEYALMYVKHQDKVLKVKLDLEDVEKVKSVGAWHAIYDKTVKNSGYYIAHRYMNKEIGKGVIKLHRFIMNCPRDKVIDHINHNTLDNRKINLKICSLFENQQNLRSNKSGIVGVHYRAKGYWVASITKNSKRYSKEFKTKEEAIIQRKKWENELYNKGGDE